jgi:hypothetical protein
MHDEQVPRQATTTTTPTRLGRRGQRRGAARAGAVEQTGQEQSAGGAGGADSADGADGRHRLLTQHRGRMELEGRGRTGSGQGAGVGDTQMRGQRASDQASLLARFGERVWGACWPGETPLRNCVAVAKAGKGSQRGRQASMSSVKRQASGGRRQASSGERRASSIHRGCWPGSSRAAVEANPSLRGGRRRRWREWCKR